jgi:hypothetical protein
MRLLLASLLLLGSHLGSGVVAEGDQGAALNQAFQDSWDASVATAGEGEKPFGELFDLAAWLAYVVNE